MLADISSGDLSILFILIALACFAGAAYCAWLRNIPATILLVFVGVVVLVVP